jgi:3-phenylpropionate/cinnamic acid dioxygenase small subunit
MDSSENKALQELIDHEKIRRLFYRYAFGCDTSDADAILSVFDDPCTLVLHSRDGGPPETLAGRAAVDKFFRVDLVPFNNTRIVRHRITNQLVDIEGDHGRARVYWDEVREVKEPRSHLILGGGTYIDKLRRVGSEWKISERAVYSNYWMTLFDDVEKALKSGQVVLTPRIKGIWGPIP